MALVVTLAACGGATPEPVDPLSYLGPLDTRAEADGVARDVEAAGYTPSRRLDRARFVAMTFARADGHRTFRVVSRRGIVVALDSHDVLGNLGPSGLFELDADTTEDFDGDGEPEAVLRRRYADHDCLDIFDVDDEGALDAFAVPTRMFADRPFPAATGTPCVEGWISGAPGTATPLVALCLHEGLTRRACAPLELVARDGARVLERPSVRVLEERRATLAARIDAARATPDPEEGLALAAEAALLELVEGHAFEEVLASFDRVRVRFVLDADQASRADLVRASLE